MKKCLYNCAVLFHPRDENEDTELLVFKHVLASSQDAAKIEVLRHLPERIIYAEVNEPTIQEPYPSDQLEVIVRPF